MKGEMTFSTRARVARESLRQTIAEQLDRSIPTGLLGTDGQASVADELLQAITRPAMWPTLQILSCEMEESSGPRWYCDRCFKSHAGPKPDRCARCGRTDFTLRSTRELVANDG